MSDTVLEAENQTELTSFSGIEKDFKELIVWLDREISSTESEQEVDEVVKEFSRKNVVGTLIDLSAQDRRLRKQIKSIISQSGRGLYERSGLLDHAISKPYGYPGDFEILEQIYENEPFQTSRSNAGRAMDMWAMHSKLPTAVVERKNILQAELESQVSQGAKRLLSIASGSARELRDLSAIPEQIDLLDHDPRSFDYIKKMGSEELIKHCDFHTDDAMKPLGEYGIYDIVYSFGLFDYLPDKFLDRIIKWSTSHLAEKGQYIFCLKDHHYYDAWFYDWFCDWAFVPRVKEDGYKVAERNGLSVKKEMLTDNKAVCVYVCEPMN